MAFKIIGEITTVEMRPAALHDQGEHTGKMFNEAYKVFSGVAYNPERDRVPSLVPTGNGERWVKCYISNGGACRYPGERRSELRIAPSQLRLLRAPPLCC